MENLRTATLSGDAEINEAIATLVLAFAARCLIRPCATTLTMCRSACVRVTRFAIWRLEKLQVEWGSSTTAKLWPSRCSTGMFEYSLAPDASFVPTIERFASKILEGSDQCIAALIISVACLFHRFVGWHAYGRCSRRFVKLQLVVILT